MAIIKPKNLERLVEQHGSMLYKFCRKLTLNKEDADDLFQETYLKAVEQCNKIDQSKNPMGYLIYISIYLWKSSRRKYARRQYLAPTKDMQKMKTMTWRRTLFQGN